MASEHKAREVIQKFGLWRAKIEDVLKSCPYTLEELRSPSRKRNLVDWRIVASLIFYKDSHFCLSEAGSKINRDHSNIHHSINAAYLGIPEIEHKLKQVREALMLRPSSDLCNLCITEKLRPHVV